MSSDNVTPIRAVIASAESREEAFSLADSYLERCMKRLTIFNMALRDSSAADAEIRQTIIELLDSCVYSDLGLVRDMLKGLEVREAPHG